MSAFVVEATLLLLAALLPVAWALHRRPHPVGRRDPALALHRAQLDEIERDQNAGLLAASEHQAARLEVQRRLLAAALPDAPSGAGGARGGVLALALLPPAAVALYLVGGHPELPAQPAALRAAQAGPRAREDQALVATLRRNLATLDPAAPQARQGFILLGQLEASLGRWDEAAAAWRTALAHGFEATLAVQAAEAQSRADRRVSPDSAALFRRALDAAPQAAPWRQLAGQRIAQAEHELQQH